MGNDRRHAEKTRLGPVPVDCPTPSKGAWVTRRAAKAAGNRLRDKLSKHPTTGRKPQVYACPCGFYHLGHLPAAVVFGDSSRADLRRTA